MRAFVARLPDLAAALWWGSLSTIGFLVVPMLFRYLPTPAIAGAMAARLFSAQTWVAIGCALLMMMMTRSERWPEIARRVHAVMPLILGALLCALLVEFAVAPRIVARINLPLWHGVGTGLYVLQWLLTSALLWRLSKPQPAAR